MSAVAGIAVITGAGQGLGRALSRELVSRGQIVAGLALCAERLAETGALCDAPDRFRGIVCDVADDARVAEAFTEIRRMAPVSILINNAAVYPRRDFLDETPASFMRTIAVNLGGVAACCRHALDDMVAAGSGRILNVSSFADLDPIPASGAYAVSKGAGRILTRALVADLGDRFPGIVINDWLPGVLATQMGCPRGLDPAEAARWGAELALSRDPGLNGTLWERDTELLAPLSLKRRLFNLLTLRRPPPPRRLGG